MSSNLNYETRLTLLEAQISQLLESQAKQQKEQEISNQTLQEHQESNALWSAAISNLSHSNSKLQTDFQHFRKDTITSLGVHGDELHSILSTEASPTDEAVRHFMKLTSVLSESANRLTLELEGVKMHLRRMDHETRRHSKEAPRVNDWDDAPSNDEVGNLAG